MRKSIAAFVSAALLMTPLAAAQDAPRAHTGKWIVDFAESQCVAALDYGEPGDPEMLLFKVIPSGNHVQVAMVSDGRKFKAKVKRGEIRVNGSKREAQLLHYGTTKNKTVYRFLMPGTVDSIASIERIELDLPGIDYDLAIPQMDEISKVLGQCLVSLREYWNVDNGKIAVGPQGDVRTIFSSRDYPAQAFRDKESGIARAFLLIDEEGKVADCTISAFAGNVLFATQTCAVMVDRLEMEPARDAEGNAVRSSYGTPSIRWIIQGGTPMDELQAEMDRLTDAAGNCIEFGGTC